MASPLQITYLDHSGFAVRSRSTLLIFDDAQGLAGEGDSLANGRITRELLESVDRTVYFVSHSHEDHYHPDIFKLSNAGLVHYVLGHDVPLDHGGHRMFRGDTLSLAGAEITAHDSTDEGVSFLVKIDGWTLFHAGDLNLWHWREESTYKEIEQAERAYLDAVAPLLGEAIDVAFFPLDPRMGQQYDAGAQHFLMHVKPRVMIPMHWWKRADVAIDFARRNQTKHVEILALTAPGQTVQATKQEDGQVIIDEPAAPPKGD